MMIPPPERHLGMEAFWEWLQGHPNCILRCGSAETTLFDHDDFHWLFFDEEDRRGIIQMLKGKDLVGEIVIPRRQVRDVRMAVDLESGTDGHWMAELLGGSEAEPEVLFHVLLSHGFEEPPAHGTLRH